MAEFNVSDEEHALAICSSLSPKTSILDDDNGDNDDGLSTTRAPVPTVRA